MTAVNKRALSLFYKKYKEEFLTWIGSRYDSLSREDVEDLYQEASVRPVR